MERYLRFPNGKAKALTLSYDDGVVFDEKLIEIMQKHGIKGTFNLNSGAFGRARRLTEEQSKKLYTEAGMEVAIHGYGHQWPNALHGIEIYKEFVTDKENLEELFGGVIRGMAYAQGRYSDEVVEVLKQIGVAYARTTECTQTFALPTDWLRLKPTCHHYEGRLKELINQFNDANPDTYRNKQPLLFYLWGHSYEFNDHDNWNIFEDFCEKVGDRDDVWYATNIEVYDYIKAYENLHFSANGKYVQNNSAIDVYIYVGGSIVGRTVCAKAGTTTQIL